MVRPWWQRHATLLGSVVGAALGLGGYYAYVHDDAYCRDPDMFPCETAIPFFVLGGAAGGAGLGYLVFHEDLRPQPASQRTDRRGGSWHAEDLSRAPRH
jgi:hypothetical protein